MKMALCDNCHFTR